MKQDKVSDSFWTNVTRDYAIRRLFPELSKSAIEFNDMLPGRSWEAYKLPVLATDFDKEIYRIINGDGSSNFLPKEDLDSKGILCPYYSWRIAVCMCVENAVTAFNDLSVNRRSELESLRDQWEARIRATKGAISSKVEVKNYIGSVYLNTEDFYSEDVDLFRSLYEETRQKITMELERDVVILSGINNEISRIDQIATRTSDGHAPNIWRMSFYVFMASFWRTVVGKYPPVRDSSFQNLLLSASTLIGGEQHKIESWGQYKTAREKTLNSPPGAGSRIGEIGFFCLEEEEQFAARGEECKDLIDFAKDEELPFSFSTIANCIMLLRDHSEGHLFLICRDLVLRELMDRTGMINNRALVQLGWIAPEPKHILLSSLKYAINNANSGDVPSAIVVEAAFAHSEWARWAISQIGWPNHFADLREQQIFDAADALDGKIFPEMTGDERALDVSMRILNDCDDLSLEKITLRFGTTDLATVTP